MKRFKIKGFTLSELMVIFAIMAIVAASTTVIIKSRMEYATKMAYYATFKNLRQAAGEMIANGFSINGGASIEKKLPAEANQLDSNGVEVGFCTKLSEVFNTIGAIDCTKATKSDFIDSNVNFKTSNGMKFFNMSADPSVSATHNPAEEIYNVFIDINGVTGSEELDEDIMEFSIDRNGLVLPAKNSKGAEDKDFLSASVKYDTIGGGNSSPTWFKRGISYREAVCIAGQVTTPTSTTYCTGYSVSPNCTAVQPCEVSINKP